MSTTRYCGSKIVCRTTALALLGLAGDPFTESTKAALMSFGLLQSVRVPTTGSPGVRATSRAAMSAACWRSWAAMSARPNSMVAAKIKYRIRAMSANSTNTEPRRPRTEQPFLRFIDLYMDESTVAELIDR